MKFFKLVVVSVLLFLLKNMHAQESMMSHLKSHLYNVGTVINDTELPIFGKLGALLPFAVTSFCLQQFPEQTMILLSGCLLYILSKQEHVRSILNKYNFWNKKPKNRRKQKLVQVHLEDDFFVFDGDDLLDAEEEEDEEDELLDDERDVPLRKIKA